MLIQNGGVKASDLDVAVKKLFFGMLNASMQLHEVSDNWVCPWFIKDPMASILEDVKLIKECIMHYLGPVQCWAPHFNGSIVITFDDIADGFQLSLKGTGYVHSHFIACVRISNNNNNNFK